MDGNGRWATSQGKKRVDGHLAGSEVVREITTFVSKREDISELTLYAFSTENWKRPKLEVDFLMNLLSKYLERETSNYIENGVKFKAVGDISKFSKKLQRSILKLEEKTKNLTNLTQNLALNYGGKDEIIRTLNRLKNEKIDFSEDTFKDFLDVKSDVDLLIRTGGDKRISNFLLWQIAYAELFFIDTLWPDFSKENLIEIVDKFYKIDRRFGGLNS
jgi:undecaprenyl diphosphate synthase